MDAVTRNHFNVAKLLVEAGASIEIRGHDDMTAIDIARRNGNSEMLKSLMAGKIK